MTLVLNGEDFRVVTLARGEVGITRLELQVEALAAGFAVVVLELDFAINAPIGVWDGAENLPCLSGNSERMANQDQFATLVVDACCSLLLKCTHPLLELRRGEFLFNQI